jgi:hypothetical protein
LKIRASRSFSIQNGSDLSICFFPDENISFQLAMTHILNAMPAPVVEAVCLPAHFPALIKQKYTP